MERYRMRNTNEPIAVNPDYILPCDVTLGGPRHVTIQAGCLLRTLIVALQVRERAHRSAADILADELSLRATK
jgi:hypothetical protein